eukprot:TRINITY_DN9889_c0_g1_i1.p1 TRINITY_DN9889_c0_g1~~TRINITY_DN9889_c0_g1_i1.p1  ORF type:complete len:159 (+),score=29.56 TRINITY_DN9889_c0_g1_i1:37-477(+)
MVSHYVLVMVVIMFVLLLQSSMVATQQYSTRQQLLDYFTSNNLTYAQKTFDSPPNNVNNQSFTNNGYKYTVSVPSPLILDNICAGSGLMRAAFNWSIPVTLTFRPPKYPTSIGMGVEATMGGCGSSIGVRMLYIFFFYDYMVHAIM